MMTRQKRRSLHVVSFAVLAATLPVCGENLFSGIDSPVWVDVPSGTTSFTDFLAIGDGIVHKTGEGTFSIPFASLMPAEGQKVAIQGGTFEIRSGGTRPSVPEPSWLRERAGMWLSAKSGESQFAVENGTDVVRWYDVREGDSTAQDFSPAYMFASRGANTITGSVDSPSLTTFGGAGALYFGGYGSGKNMDYKNPDDTKHTAGDVWHYFVVHAVTRRVGALAGVSASGVNYNNDFAYHVASYHITNTTGVAYGLDRAAAMRTRFYRNGAFCDQTKTVPNRGSFELVDYAVQVNAYNNESQPPQGERIDGLFRQGYNTSNADIRVRGGGDYVSEVMLFTNILTHAERVELESYLMAKWGIGELATIPGAAVASGARYRVDVESGTTMRVPELSGEGVLAKTGGGALHGVADRNTRPIVPVALEEGTFVSRGGDAFHALAGQRLTADAVTHVATNKIVVTPSAEAAGAFVKAGKADLEVTSLDGGVSSLTVAEGRLRVTGGNVADLDPDAEGAGLQEIALQNASFETRPTGTSGLGWKYNSTSPSTTLPGWTIRMLVSGGNLCWTYRGYTGNIVGLCTPIAGDAFMSLSSFCEMRQDVTLASAGRYEVSVLVCGQTTSFFRNPLEIDLVNESVEGNFVTNRLLYTRANHNFGFVRVNGACDVATAGTYQLIVRSCANNVAVNIDDIHLYYRPAGRLRRWLVPNGDFEKFVSSSYRDVSGANTVEGWTLEQALGRADAYPSVAFVNHVSKAAYFSAGVKQDRLGANENALSQSRRLPYGGVVALAFISNGVARTTFTPPAGQWRLKAVAASPFNYLSASSESSLGATVTAAGQTTSLGEILGPATTMPQDATWPLPFVADGVTPVTLELSFSAYGMGELAVDDLELVEAVDGVELVTDGGLETHGDESTSAKSFAAWDLLNSDGTPVTSYTTEAGWHSYSGGALYSHEVWDGSGYAVLSMGRRLRQTVNFPTAGNYRIAFASHKRDDTYYRTDSPTLDLQVSVCDTDAVPYVTNFTATVTQPCSNFVQHVYTFNIPSAGARTLEFMVLTNENVTASAAWQYENILDGVSIRQIGESLNATPIPQDASVVVAAGATLELGFTGTNRVESLSLGGVKRTGIVSAANAPGFIAGVGALEIQPKGAILIFR